MTRRKYFHFAKRLRDARRGAGLTQAQAARALGRGIRTLQDWEQARSRPRGQTRLEILAKLQTFGQPNGKEQ